MRTLNQEPVASQQSLNLFKVGQRPIFLSDNSTVPPNHEDIPQCISLMEKMLSLQPELTKKADHLLQQISNKDYTKGIGYYNSKNMLMLEYLIQLQFYQLFKINGEDLTTGQGLELYKRLVYLKTLMTKLGPVEKKLEYQKNKLLQYSDVINVKAEKKQKEENDQGSEGESEQENDEEDEQGAIDSNEEEQGQQEQVKGESQDQDALMYQPRPKSLLQVKQKKKAQAEQQGKYIAPKMSAVLSKEDKKKRREEIQQQRRKAFLMRKYRGDLEDQGEQAQEAGMGNQLAQKMNKKFAERTEYELSNMMRFPETKKQKMWKKSMVRRHERSNPLYDDLKDLQVIRQIFSEKKDEPSIISKKLKRPKSQQPQEGRKKRKME